MTDQKPIEQPTTSTAIAPIVKFKRVLGQLVEAKELALPDSVRPEAFKNAAIVAVQDNPGILGCDETSVFKAIRKLAAAGLVPDGREAALVPFKTKINDQYVSVCQAMPMVFGLIKTARNSGEVSDIRAHIVYQREVDEDRFTYVVGDEERLEHEPILFGDKGPPVACYAIARLKDGSIIREFMSADEIDKVRRSGASQLNFKKGERPTVSETPKGIWSDWAGEMWKKTVIRRLCKRLPIAAEDLRRVMQDEDNLKDAIRDVTPREPGGFAKRALGISTQDTSTEPVGAPPEAAVAEAEVLPAQDDSARLAAALEALAADGFPGAPSFTKGAEAFAEGRPITDCPYDPDADAMSKQAAQDWCGGYVGARRAAE